jgi:hypothetical protein
MDAEQQHARTLRDTMANTRKDGKRPYGRLRFRTRHEVDIKLKQRATTQCWRA